MFIRETFAHHVQLTLPIPTANFDAKPCDLCAMPSYAKLLLCPGDEFRSDMFLDHGPNVTNRFSVFLGTMAGTVHKIPPRGEDHWLFSGALSGEHCEVS